MEETLNRAINLTDLSGLAAEQYAVWSDRFDESNEIDEHIRSAEDALEILFKSRRNAKERQAEAWRALVRAANAAFDLNKSKI